MRLIMYFILNTDLIKNLNLTFSYFLNKAKLKNKA